MTKHTEILLFSPTNTTKKVCMAVARGMGVKDFQLFDITLPESRSIL